MRISGSILVLAIFVSAAGSRAQAQQSDSNSNGFDKAFQTSFAKARDACKTLWSDHAFDSLRAKIPLDADKPTFEMLKNTEKLKANDRPVADLAIKTLEKCRAAYIDVYAMLPQQTSAMIHGVERQQDALIADLYRGKINFGEFNTSASRLTAQLTLAVAGAQTTEPTPALPETSNKSATKAAPQPKAEHKENAPAPPFHEIRLALVIGNSSYVNLPKLSNPANDARAVADVLSNMGYQTHLLLDASEQKLRHEIREFASGSTKADVALVFYAGHGAQVNGNNYLLPTDMDIPRTDVDIQFAALKVDDLVNSIASNTKIVFLDACRDNPVLFKNLVKGRGSSPAGLAPASSSNFEQKSGGGVFIAYATDAGAVADDGNGSHSPFTQALLRNIRKPISIDDMFSFVTKEVRLVTKNAQRPYKYASLENIVCVAPNCSSTAGTTKTDVFQQAVQSETDELQIALQTRNPDALETFLQKYPDSSKRSEILEEVQDLKRSEFTEWTMYEIGGKANPQYLQLGSIKRLDGRSFAKMKILVNSANPKVFYGRPLPDAAYQEQINVYDCTSPRMALSEDSIFNAAGELLFHYKWGDPKYLKISTGGFEVQPGSVGHVARTIVCSEALSTPLVNKRQMATMDFITLSSMSDGNGEILYQPPHKGQSDPTQLEIIMIFKNFVDRNVRDFFPEGVAIPDPPNYREEVDLFSIRCDFNQFAITRTEHWDATNRLVRTQFVDPTRAKLSEIKPNSPAAGIEEIYCQKGYAGVGIRFAEDKNSIVAKEIFGNSPAEKAGIAANDIIFQIDGEPVAGLTLQQITEKIRGPEGTKIKLKMLRKDQDNPIEFSLARATINVKAVEGGSK
jgi:caspase domain-containing protein/PDZ domain-containing protein